MSLLVLALLSISQDNPPAAPDSPFEPGAKLEVLGPPGSAGEGPAWHPKLGIFTSGHKGIHRLDFTNSASVFLPDAETNGLLWDPKGNLLACQPGKKRIIKISPEGTITVLADQYQGKPFNTPNDLTLDDEGRIYFSDPRYGPKEGMEQKDEKGEFIEGVYRIDPDGKVSRVIGRQVDRANGVLVSKDGKWLYVAENNNDTKGGARMLSRFRRSADGSIDLSRKEYVFGWKQGRGPDGLKQDQNGLLYVAGGLNRPNPPFEPDADIKGGIYVIDPNKELNSRLIAFLPVPTDEVTNCAFGGADGKTLYITGGGVLYSIRTKTPGFVRLPAR